MKPIAADVPKQIAEFEPVLAEGIGLTVTVTLFVFTQPAEVVSKRIYLVVVIGLTEGLETKDEKPVGLLDQE